MEELIEDYLNQIKTKGDLQEKYKWEAITNFQNNWDINDPNFKEMFLKAFSKISNLLYQNSWGFIKKSIELYPSEIKEMFSQLYSEDISIEERFKQFIISSEALLPKLKTALGKNKINAQQDERTLSVYLSFKYPEKYFIYMHSFYSHLCSILNEKEAPTGKKYFHYLELANRIKQNYIINNKELIEIHLKTFPKVDWDDINLITQNFLYVELKKQKIFMKKENIPAYYCVGFHFYGKDESNQLPRFIKNDIWENGYEDKFTNVVNLVPIGSLIAAKTSYTMREFDKTISVLEVHCIGKVTDNLKDGKTLKVEWEKDFKSFKLKRKGAYRNTISQVHNQDNINAIFYNNEPPNLINIEVNDDAFKLEFPLNQILYGPPGTGKTYTTKQIAIEIIDGKNYQEYDREDVLKRYEELVKGNQIHFTTFHQSMSYEDFIEGIKPVMIDENEIDLRYEIQQGIFKTISKKALSEYYKQDILSNNNKPIQRMNFFDDAWNFLIEKAQKALDDSNYLVLKTVTNKELEISSISNQGNLIIRPKFENSLEYIVSYSRTRKLFEVFDDLETVKNIDKEFRAVIGGANITAYWSVLNFINQWVENNDYAKDTSEEKLIIKDDLIKFDNDIVKKNIDKKVSNYVLIIDEINRGNISSIFGELITLLEEDKRLGRDEAILVNLPYSKLEKFGVPPNLYIIGTMNTADRSVEALDTALRRRFSFTEIQYNPEVIEFEHPTNGIVNFEDEEINLITLLNTINNRIEILIDKDHKIGHSYFINTSTFEELTSVFNNKVIPLLEEYFFGDFGKIGLVLGSAFIIPVENGNKVKFATNFPYDDKEMLREKSIYKFTDKTVWNADSFISIYSEN